MPSRPSHQASAIAVAAVLGAPADLAAALTDAPSLRRDPGPARVLLTSTCDDVLAAELHDAAPGCEVTISRAGLDALASSGEPHSFDAVIIAGDRLTTLLRDGGVADAASVDAALARLESVARHARTLLSAGGALYVDCAPGGPSVARRVGVPVSNEPELVVDVEWRFAPDAPARTQRLTASVTVHREPTVDVVRTGLLVGSEQVRAAVTRAGFTSLVAVPMPRGSDEVLRGFVARFEA